MCTSRSVVKTVLLGSFRNEALGQRWVVIENEVSKHSNEAFRRDIVSDFRTALFELSPKARWGDRLKRAASVLKSFSIEVDPSGSLTAGVDVAVLERQSDSGTLHRDLSDLFVAVGEAAQAEGRGVVLLFDEVQFLTPTPARGADLRTAQDRPTRPAGDHGRREAASGR